eukprot:6471962-Karenia_brevis.AAC.1
MWFLQCHVVPPETGWRCCCLHVKNANCSTGAGPECLVLAACYIEWAMWVAVRCHSETSFIP